MKIIYTHINTRTRTCTRSRTHTRALVFKYTHSLVAPKSIIQYWVRWQQCVWLLSVELGAPFGQLFMHACVCYACCVWCVCDAHDWCLPAPDCAFGVYFYVASFGRQPTNHRDNEHNENVVDFFTIPIKSSGFASLFKFSWVRNASRIAAPLLIAFMVLSTLVVVLLSRLCLSRNRSHSNSHNAVALIK